MLASVQGKSSNHLNESPGFHPVLRRTGKLTNCPSCNPCGGTFSTVPTKERNMKKLFQSISVVACGLAAIILGSGCSSTNTQQVAHSISGDGVLANATVPVTGSTSIGLKLFVGRFSDQSGINPTGTNLRSAPFAIVAAGHGKQSVSGSVATNSAAGIADASHDTATIVLGPAETEDGTNGVTASGK